MHKNKSFVNDIRIYLLILTGLLVVILGVFLMSSYSILENEIKDSSDAFLKIYSNEFRNNTSEMDNLLASITTQGEDLAKIRSSSENERSLSAIALSKYLQDLVSGNTAADFIVVYDGTYNICLDAIKNSMNYDKKNSLRDFTCQAVSNSKIHSYEWNFVTLRHETYLYKMLISEDRAIAVYVKTNRLLNSLTANQYGKRSIALVSNTGEIGKIWGNETKDIKENSNLDEINRDNYYVIKNPVIDGEMTIYCFTSIDSIFQQTHTSMLVVAITVCAAVLFMLFILQYTKKEITVPMKRMVGDMKVIQNGEFENRLDGNFNTREFQMLQDTTNRMVDEIVGLKIQTYEKRIELQDMELKSIRLQLKPHFFLNALTTISSLSSQNKNEQIREYIDALSKNVRYMFRAGFHTVSIKDEIRHVENYFEMQELKYPGCIFYLIDLPKELEEWKVPQMLIHTFIENEYKYAVSMDETLTILIKVSRQSYGNEEHLMIEIEDDGKGYPKEVLDYMNGLIANTSEKGTRIGLWSIKRMLELMYEREDLLILENIDPHGCMNRIYIPSHATHELSEETIYTKI